MIIVPPAHLPIWASLLALVASVLVLAYAARLSPNRACMLVVLALGARYTTSQFPDIALRSFGGFSINAMVSMATIGIGLLVVRTRLFVSPWMLPIGLCIAVTLASGLRVNAIGGTIETTLKWLYLAIMIAALLDSSERSGFQRTMRPVLLAFAPPLMFQLIAVALGRAKASEADGSASFIGGYFHESGFSMVVLGFLMAVTVTPRMAPRRRLALVAVGLASLILANYRTALLAGLPVAVGALTAMVFDFTRPGRRAIVLVIAGPIVVLALLGVSSMQERFADLTSALSSTEKLFVPPEYYTWETRKLMSARPFIWSQYLTEYGRGSDMDLILGYGPNAWEGNFQVYAHNTIISALYETGIVGVASFLFLWIAFIAAALLQRGRRIALLFGHLGFILLNMSTMPYWSIEGIIIYAILAGATLQGQSIARTERPMPLRRRQAAYASAPGSTTAVARWRPER